RLVVEASAAGRLRVALTVRRAMRRGDLPAPGVPGVLLRATAAPLFLALLLAATALALAMPGRLAVGAGLGCVLAGLGIAVAARRP
ncbi:MAG TPA: hypothetical protein VFU54_15615, partial [Actinomycetota bacterium]|nr:hypothetical protein [Actinomycetota bacterium]